MKVIVTGVTGFIGSRVLAQAVADPRITSIVALSRKPLPIYDGVSKVDVQIVPDFAHFESSVVESWKGAEACLWCLGLAIPPTVELAQLLAITYPKALLDTFARAYSPEEQQRFRFICLSGALVERDQNKTMWFLENERKLRGQTETQVLTDSFSNPEIPSIVIRPFAVTQSNAFALVFNWTGCVIRNTVLAAAIVDLGVKGVDSDSNDPWNGRVVENSALVSRGARVLREQQSQARA